METRKTETDRKLEELTVMAEILRDSGFAESALYADVLAAWTKAYRMKGVEACYA